MPWPPTVADPNIVNGTTFLDASHVNELRTAMDDVVARVDSPVVLFSNQDVTGSYPTRALVQNGTLSATRTVTLPAASSVPAGYTFLVADQSGTVTATNRIVVARQGGDTLHNPMLLRSGGDTTYTIGNPYGYLRFRSDGTGKWMVEESTGRRAYFYWQHPRKIAVPSSATAWRRVPFHTVWYDTDNQTQGLTASTTVAAASNGQALPLAGAVLNVASTASFDTSGALVIRVVTTLGAEVDTVVRYTGKTATTFTGCQGGAGVATLATNMVVEAANHKVNVRTPAIYQLVAQVTWTRNAVGGRGIRVMQGTDAAGIPINSNGPWPTYDPGATGPLIAQQVVCQPAQSTVDTTSGLWVEVFQDSGSTLNLEVDGLLSPSIRGVYISGE